MAPIHGVLSGRKVCSEFYMVFDDKFKRELLASIPIVNSMGLDFHMDDNTVKVDAPLSKHINYEGSAFGGSINSVAVLSCYLMARYLAEETLGQRGFSLVIHDSQIKYRAPIRNDFQAQARRPSDMDIKKFSGSLARKGKGRISLVSHIVDESGATCAEFHGRYVIACDT